MSTGPADKGLDLFKTLVFDQIVNTLTSAIIGLAPWLSLPFFSFIVRKTVKWISEKLYEQLSQFINFEVILLRNAEYHREYISACIALNGIAKTLGIDSPEFKVARNEHKKALAKFVRYSGT